MIGIEYLCKLNDLNFVKLGEECGVTRQVVNSWVKGRSKVSEKHKEKLEKLFNVPFIYFNKELNDIDKIELQKMKIEREIKKVSYKDEKENDLYLEFLDYQIKIKKLSNRIYDLIYSRIKTVGNINGFNEIFQESDDVYDTFLSLLKIIKKDNIRSKTIKEVIEGLELYSGGESENELSKEICNSIKKQETKLKELDEREEIALKKFKNELQQKQNIINELIKNKQRYK
ncbi:helix-turn-helix domain-containing protein [Eubacterium multiforme]|uniref:Transcriptional regulator with XRE-family HTH domain n=1 Tax=Eubacterium multiforme TaxID=83339 RepID=A0ABT9USB0_9FIRM|nr:helix-turn-helix domain-containing protein [Eubacterium multiforme]MDQ0149202.1 transcriptional regulator with XRE-family HTH domain [Eubacterium multiforme]